MPQALRASTQDHLGAKLPCHKLPPAENYARTGFVGRNQYLETMASSLLPSGSGQPISVIPKAFAIVGVAGQGKTQTALQFALRHKHLYDAILWAHADESHKILQDFADFAVALGLQAKTTNDQLADAKVLKHWFETTGRHKPVEKDVFVMDAYMCNSEKMASRPGQC